MHHFDEDIAALVRGNEDFRRVVKTGEHSQVVLMTIQPGSEIGEEVHEDVDQVLVFVEGRGEAVIEGDASPVGPEQLAFVAAGTRHNFRNTGDAPLKLWTVYAPPEHPDGTVHRSKEEADEYERAHH